MKTLPHPALYIKHKAGLAEPKPGLGEQLDLVEDKETRGNVFKNLNRRDLEE